MLGIHDAVPLASCTTSGGATEQDEHGAGDGSADVAHERTDPGAEHGSGGSGERRGGEDLGHVAGRDEEAVVGGRQRDGDRGDGESGADEAEHAAADRDGGELGEHRSVSSR